jgi:hypothetical protein
MTGLATLTLLHVLISLIGIAAGLIAVAGWLKSDLARLPTTIFLITTVLTSVTGFFFPFVKLMPSHILGIISLVMLAFAAFAFYRKHLSGVWRSIFAVTALLSLYLNVLVLVVQSFQKVPILKALAPTQTEPSFLVAQGLALIVFVILTIVTAVRFRPVGFAAG